MGGGIRGLQEARTGQHRGWGGVGFAKYSGGGLGRTEPYGYSGHGWDRGLEPSTTGGGKQDLKWKKSDSPTEVGATI